MTPATNLKTIQLPWSLRVLRRINFPRKLGICERIYGRKLSTFGMCRVKCATGINWALDLNDVGHRWMVYGYYEGGVGISYAKNRLQHGGIYVDSGANIGQWMVYLSYLQGVKTYAFEPVLSERAWLAECLNNYPNWDVELIPTALGDKQEALELQCAGSRSTFHTQWYEGQNNKIINVDVDRLDSMMQSNSVEKIDFWKLDVEGYEYEALLGARSYLNDKKIGCVYFECHPNNFNRINTYLGQLNYSIYRVFKKRLVEVGAYTPVETENFIAEPKSN